MGALTTLAILAGIVLSVKASCRRANWWDSFDKEGISKCDSSGEYINGLYRNVNGGGEDYILRLEEAECCSRQSPWEGSSSLFVYADWWNSFDNNNNWNMCPQGYFLQGLYRTGDKSYLHNIEEGKCARPADHPPYYGDCYDQDVNSCFNDKGLCKCNADYFITGLYRSNCNLLYCIETFKCCKMRSSREVLDEKYKVKTLVMDTTLWDMANLATYLGYGWCAGCRAQYVGEDFVKDGDTWRAATSSHCDGYMHNTRLAIAFADWGFALKDIKFGDPVITDLHPETIDDGPVYNNDASPLTHTVHRSQTITKTVTHTTTSAWKMTNELDFTIGYTPPAETGGESVSMTYKFSYETSSSTTDSTGNTHSKTFDVSSSKTLAPYSAAKWKVIVAKTRRTIPYTVTVIPTFSAEFQGFLRWGGGYNGGSTNYHYKYRGSGERKLFNYKFGDGKTPFYTALKRQSDTSSRPWMWADMIQKHPAARSYINSLINENRYTFILTGKFDDVDGKHVVVEWETIPLPSRRKRHSEETPNNTTIVSEGSHEARSGPNDPESPQVQPPVVDLEVNETSTTSETPIPVGTPLV